MERSTQPRSDDHEEDAYSTCIKQNLIENPQRDSGRRLIRLQNKPSQTKRNNKITETIDVSNLADGIYFVVCGEKKTKIVLTK